MSLWGKIKLGWQVKKASDAVAQANASGFSWGLAFKKAGQNFLVVLGGMLLFHFSDPSSWRIFTDVLPENLQKVLVPLTVSAAMLVDNWRKNRKNVVLSMVEVEPPSPTDRRAGPTPKLGAAPVSVVVKPVK